MKFVVSSALFALALCHPQGRGDGPRFCNEKSLCPNGQRCTPEKTVPSPYTGFCEYPPAKDGEHCMSWPAMLKCGENSMCVFSLTLADAGICRPKSYLGQLNDYCGGKGALKKCQPALICKDEDPTFGGVCAKP